MMLVPRDLQSQAVISFAITALSCSCIFMAPATSPAAKAVCMA